MRKYILISLMLICYSASAEIYKRVDADGNVHFSDSEAGGAEQVELPPANTYTPAEVGSGRELDKPKPEDQAAGYTEIAIVKPELNETLRSNIGDVSVSINLSPALRSGDSITLYMDGKELLQGKTQTSFTLSGIERGSHTLRASVIDSDGANLISSKSILFHLHKVVAKKKTENESKQESKRNYNLSDNASSAPFSSGSNYKPGYNQ